MQGYAIQQSTAIQPLIFLLVQSSDHITPLTGATPTVLLSKSGGAFAAPAGAVTEIGDGWYQVAANATDSGTLGPLVLHATAASGDPCDAVFPVVAYNPLSGANLGLTALPTAAPAAAGGLPTVDAANGVKLSVGTAAGQVNASGGKVPATMGATDYSGNTVQTGDTFARIGATGSGLTSLAPAATALSSATWTPGRAGYLDYLNVGGAVASHADATSLATQIGTPMQAGASVTVATNNDKAGYALASTGLDAIATTAPTGVATTFPQMLIQVWRRYFRKVVKTTTGNTITTYADDGVTAVTTQPFADDGTGNETLGAA